MIIHSFTEMGNNMNWELYECRIILMWNYMNGKLYDGELNE